MKLIQEINGDGSSVPGFPHYYDGSLFLQSINGRVLKWNKDDKRIEIFAEMPSEEYREERFDLVYILNDKLVYQNQHLWLQDKDWASYFVFSKNGILEDKHNLKMTLHKPFNAASNATLFAHSPHTTYAYNPFEKKILWEKNKEDDFPTYTFDNYILFLNSSSSVISSYNSQTGQKLWTTDLNKYLRTNFYGDKEEISHLDIHYHAYTNQILVCTSWGYLISINPETGHINQAKQTLKGVGIIDPYSDMSYPTSTSAFNGTDTRKYDLQLYAQDITNEGEPIFIKEYTPDMFGLKGNRLSTIKNIGYRSTVGCNEHSLFIAFYGQGSIFQIDKKTGDIVDRYKVPKNELEGHPFVFDNHLFVPTKHGGANPYSLLVFDTSMP